MQIVHAVYREQVTAQRNTVKDGNMISDLHIINSYTLPYKTFCLLKLTGKILIRVIFQTYPEKSWELVLILIAFFILILKKNLFYFHLLTFNSFISPLTSFHPSIICYSIHLSLLICTGYCRYQFTIYQRKLTLRCWRSPKSPGEWLAASMLPWPL